MSSICYHGMAVISNWALVDCVSWLNMKVGFYAFIFRIAILTGPLNGYFFCLISQLHLLLLHLVIFSVPLHLQFSLKLTELKAVFIFYAFLLFGTSFVLVGLPWIPLLLLSCPWFTLIAVSSTMTLLWLTILGVTQISLGHRLKTCMRGLHVRCLTSVGKSVLPVHTSNCFPKF